MKTYQSKSIKTLVKRLILILIIFIAMPRKSPLAYSYKDITNIKSNTTFYSYILTCEKYNNITNKIESISNEDNTMDIFKDKILNSFNIKINGYAITISNENFGYVTRKEDKDLIIATITKNYINKLGIDEKSLEYVGFSEKINIIPEEVEYSKVKDYSEIAQSIYEASLEDNNLLGVNITLKVCDEVEFEPITIVKEDADLYIGDKEIIEGENGVKLVNKEVVYNGDSKIDEQIIDEKVIKLSEATIVNKGIKNPYYDGIAFLSNPTSGGYISAPFGEIRSMSTHKGVDIANNLGEDVRSTLEGKVIYAGYNTGGYGNLIILEHYDNIKTYYAHLSQIYVSKGDIVDVDEVIGAIGSTGRSTGPHLHFELRVNGNPVNPLDYIEE